MYTLNEAAALLGITVRRLLQLRHEYGLTNPQRFGVQVIITEEELQALRDRRDGRKGRRRSRHYPMRPPE